MAERAGAIRRIFALALGLSAAALLAPLPVRGAAVEPTPIVVVDLHVDLPYQVGYKNREFDRGEGQVVAEHLERSGVVGVVLPLFVPNDVSPSGPRASDLEASFERVMRWIPQTPPYAPPGCGASRRPVRTWLSFEGSAPLADEPDRIKLWVERGVKLFGPVHAYDNALASSSGTPPSDRGLSDAGRVFVERVFAEGAVVDVSHASDRATDDVLTVAAERKGVVVASHSNARAVANHPRNVTDEQARRIARTGGVVGVNFHARFLTGRLGASLSDVVSHVQHLVRVAGIEHVAIGSDFEGGIRTPRELGDVRGFSRLADALVKSGLSRDDVSKIFHRNALRVLCDSAR